MDVISRPQWRDLVTFVPNKQLPVYNWFYYKEGFARQLVFELLDEMNVTSGPVLDPFCGVGTTLVACKERGLDAVGFDVSPIALLASSVKTAAYDKAALLQEAKTLLKRKFEKPGPQDVPTIMKRGFSRYALEDVLFFRSHVLAIGDKTVRDFFLLALANASLKSSWIFKDGSVLKVQKRNVAPLRVMLRRVVYGMIKDLSKVTFRPCTVAVEQADARQMPLHDETIRVVITSPPYLNQIDYTRVYAIENFIISGTTEPSLRSFLSDSAYFADMERVLTELWRVCVPGARCAVVVGNAPGIDVDLQIAQLAEQQRFDVTAIYNAKERHELERRTIQKGLLRESVVLFEKAA